MSNDVALRSLARTITEEVLGGTPFAIGDIVVHPSGRNVKIVSGQYWGTHGLSNFWYWREVLKDGTLGKEESGYGWRLRGKRSEETIAKMKGRVVSEETKCQSLPVD